jgi:hypothetical protein
MVKHELITALLLGLSVCGQAEFLPATDDIPLMEGIALSETSDFSFDTPAGQILSFDGTTEQTADRIRKFYDETLTALGWQEIRSDFYQRGKDTFQLSFPKEKNVRFDIMLNSQP